MIVGRRLHLCIKHNAGSYAMIAALQILFRKMACKKENPLMVYNRRGIITRRILNLFQIVFLYPACASVGNAYFYPFANAFGNSDFCSFMDNK